MKRNMKYFTWRIIDQENSLRRDNLRIIGLLEKAETNKNVRIILQEIIQENCTDALEQEGKNTLKESIDHPLY